MDSTLSERASTGPSAPQSNAADAIAPSTPQQQPQPSSAKSNSSGSDQATTCTTPPATPTGGAAPQSNRTTSAGASSGRRAHAHAHAPATGGAARIYAPPPLRKNRSWNSPAFERVLAGSRKATSQRTQSPGGAAQQELPPFQFPPQQSTDTRRASVGSDVLNERLQGVSLQDTGDRGRSPLAGSRACSTGHSSMERVGLSPSSSPYARFGAAPGSRNLSPAYTPLRAGTASRGRTPLSRRHLREAGAAHQHFSPLRGRPRSISSNTPYSRGSDDSQTPSSASFGVASPLSSQIASPVMQRRGFRTGETSNGSSNASNTTAAGDTHRDNGTCEQPPPWFEQPCTQGQQRHYRPPQRQTLQAALSPLCAPDAQQTRGGDGNSLSSGRSPLRPPTTNGTATNTSGGAVSGSPGTNAYSPLKGSGGAQQYNAFRPPPSPSNHQQHYQQLQQHTYQQQQQQQQTRTSPLRSPLTTRKSASQLSPHNPYVMAANASPRGLRTTDLTASRRSSSDNIFSFSQHEQTQAQLEEAKQQQQQQQQQARKQRPRKYSLPSDRMFLPPSAGDNTGEQQRYASADRCVVRRQSFQFGQAGPKTINIQSSAGGPEWYHTAMLACFAKQDGNGGGSSHPAARRRGRQRSVSMPHGGPKRRTSLPVGLHVLSSDSSQTTSSAIEVDGTMRRKRPSISGDSDAASCLQATPSTSSSAHSAAVSRRNSISTDTAPPYPLVPTVVEEDEDEVKEKKQQQQQQQQQRGEGRVEAPSNHISSYDGHLDSNWHKCEGVQADGGKEEADVEEEEEEEEEERPISAGYSSSGMSLSDNEEALPRGRRMPRPLVLDTIPESLFSGLPAGFDDDDGDVLNATAHSPLTASDDDEDGEDGADIFGGGRDPRDVMQALKTLPQAPLFEADRGSEGVEEGRGTLDDSMEPLLKLARGTSSHQQQQQRPQQGGLKRSTPTAAATANSGGGPSHNFNAGDEGRQLDGKMSPLFPSRLATPHNMDLINFPLCEEVDQSRDAQQASSQTAADSTPTGGRNRNGSSSSALAANGNCSVGGGGEDVGDFLRQFGGDILLTDPLDPLSTHDGDWDMADFDAFLDAADGSGLAALQNE